MTSWLDTNVDRRVREAGGWIGPFGPEHEPEPDMDGAFRELRRQQAEARLDALSRAALTPWEKAA